MNSVPYLNAIEQSAAELIIAISIYDLITQLEHVLSVALGSGTIFTKFEFRSSRTYPCLNYSVFDAVTLYHAVTLTSDLEL